MIEPQKVKSILSRHLLTEGFDFIVDLDKSKGSWLVDQRNGARYLDFFSMFASMAIGFNHPKLLAVSEMLGKTAVQKPSNSDVYSVAMAEFLDVFSQFGMPDYLPHAFFIEGGALAVENGLKAAFDWKVQRNFAKGHIAQCGTKIIHFQQAFHGRSGYTLSLTNTYDPRKTKYFPKFNWPRIINPTIPFPLDEPDNLHAVKKLENKALQQIHSVIAAEGDGIAGLIIEPIQGEGGDNHFRAEFFQAVRKICDENDILFILDEIQTGVGLTGKFWACEHFDVKPDILCFGKKLQVCGILVSRRIDLVKCNVFTERSRINSTFGGNLIDMVRASHILRIIKEENLLHNACVQGRLLLTELRKLAQDFPELVFNPRGRGLMCAFDVQDSETRDKLLQAFLQEKLLIAGCGEKAIRFRPYLNVSADEIMLAMTIIRKVLKQGVYRGLRVLKGPCGLST